jgi:hypothetical protein
MDVKQTILDAIKYTSRELGWTLISGNWGDVDQKCTDALGCLLIKDNPEDIDIIEEHLENAEKAAELLEVSEEWIESFLEGYDDVGFASAAKVPEAWTIGEEIRLETSPFPYEEYIALIDKG